MISYIGLGATKRETAAETTMTRQKNPSDKKTNEHWIKAEIEFEKPNHIDDRIPAKQPKFENRDEEALSSPGNR